MFLTNDKETYYIDSKNIKESIVIWIFNAVKDK